LNVAVQTTSGTVPFHKIAYQLDHAYATRHGSARLPLAPSSRLVRVINTQSGRLKAGWYKSLSGNITTKQEGWAIRNDVPYAEFVVKGTWKMFARPIEDWIKQKWQDELQTQAIRQIARQGWM